MVVQLIGCSDRKCHNRSTDKVNCAWCFSDILFRWTANAKTPQFHQVIMNTHTIRTWTKIMWVFCEREKCFYQLWTLNQRTKTPNEQKKNENNARRDKIDFVAQPTKGKFVLMMGKVYGLPNVISLEGQVVGILHSNDIANIINILHQRRKRENITHTLTHTHYSHNSPTHRKSGARVRATPKTHSTNRKRKIESVWVRQERHTDTLNERDGTHRKANSKRTQLNSTVRSDRDEARTSDETKRTNEATKRETEEKNSYTQTNTMQRLL